MWVRLMTRWWGVIVVDEPRLLFLKDTDGDDKADLPVHPEQRADVARRRQHIVEPEDIFLDRMHRLGEDQGEEDALMRSLHLKLQGRHVSLDGLHITAYLKSWRSKASGTRR